jgi:predicted phage tail protein
MRNIHRYVFLAFALVSVAMVAWAIAAGWNAPDSAKIANSTPLVQQFDADGNAVNTEDDQPVPVTSAEDGIRALGIIFANQLDEGVLTLDAIEAEQEKLALTVNELIPSYEQKVSDAREAALEAQSTVEALKAKKSLNSVEKRKLAEAEGVQANFKALNDTLNQHRENVSIMEENIASSIKANEAAQLNGDNMVALGKAIHWNLMWFYFLMVFAVAFIVISAFFNLFLNAGGLKKTLLSLVVVAVVVGVAYFLARSNGWAEGHTLKDAAGYDLGIGTDPATRTVFGTFEYMMADTSILVTYITFAGAALAAILSAVRGIFKS